MRTHQIIVIKISFLFILFLIFLLFLQKLKFNKNERKFQYTVSIIDYEHLYACVLCGCCCENRYDTVFGRMSCVTVKIKETVENRLIYIPTHPTTLEYE